MLPMNKHVAGFSKWDSAQQKVFAGAQNHNEKTVNLLIVRPPLNINTSPTPPRALCIPSFVPAEKWPRPEVVP